MAELKITLSDGKIIHTTMGVHADPSNCGYQHLSNIYTYRINQKTNTWSFDIPITQRRAINRLLLKIILENYPSIKRWVMSAIVPKQPMDAPNSNEYPINTYHFIHDNRLCKSKPVKGNHTSQYNQYTTVLSWFDHDQVSRITKRDQAILNSIVKEYKFNV